MKQLIALLGMDLIFSFLHERGARDALLSEFEFDNAVDDAFAVELGGFVTTRNGEANRTKQCGNRKQFAGTGDGHARSLLSKVTRART